MTFDSHAAYAARRISSKLNGSTKQFGWLQARDLNLGEFDIAFLAGGSSPGHGAQHPGMAQQVLSPGDAAGTEDRQGRDGAETRRLPVLDVAQGMEL
jgi:hypothetical protein